MAGIPDMQFFQEVLDAAIIPTVKNDEVDLGDHS